MKKLVFQIYLRVLSLISILSNKIRPDPKNVHKVAYSEVHVELVKKPNIQGVTEKVMLGLSLSLVHKHIQTVGSQV